LTDRNHAAGDNLAREITRANLAGAQVRPIRTSLEDAFIRLIEREDERMASQGGRGR
jgi:hypothetical protein